MLEIKGLRTEFIQYLEEHAPGDTHPAATAKNALFAYYHDIGMPFEAILRDETSMAEAASLMTAHLRSVGRKDPEADAALYHGCWKTFRAFLEATDRLALLETTEEAENKEETECLNG